MRKPCCNQRMANLQNCTPFPRVRGFEKRFVWRSVAGWEAARLTNMKARLLAAPAHWNVRTKWAVIEIPDLSEPGALAPLCQNTVPF